MNSNGIIIALLTVLVMVGIYLIVDKKNTNEPTVVKETVREVQRAAPAADGDSVEFKLNRKIKL